MIYLLLLLLVPQIYCQAWTAACSAYGTKVNCLASRYCTWTTSCVNAECHKITEPAVCRTGGQVDSACDDLVTYSPPLENTCRSVNEATLVWAFVRYPVDTSQSASTTTSLAGVPVTTFMSTRRQTDFKYDLLTLNILRSQATDIINILDAYIHFQWELQDTEIAPFYVEKAIYEAFQATRDDSEMTSANRQAILTDLWTLTEDGLFRKLRSYQSYYVSNYYFIGFGICDLNRLAIQITMQLQTFDVTWTTYTANGFMQVTTFSLAALGYVDHSSDAITLYTTKRSDGFSQVVNNIQIKWTWSDPSLTMDATSRLYTYNRLTGTSSAPVNVACTLASKFCTATGISTTANPVTYFFARSSHTANAACNSVLRNTRAKCLLNFCNTWNQASLACS